MRDTNLIVRLKAGNAEAFEELLRRYYRQVEVSIRRQLETRIGPEEARHLARAVFVRAELSAEDLRHGERLGAWLANITNTVVAEYVQAQDRPPTLEIEPRQDSLELPPW